MERRYKDGVDYWNIDVDFFENKKVRLIRGEFGIKGVYIFLMLLNEIYRNCGYYKKWDADDCLLMSDSSGVAGDCSPKLIEEVVAGLVRRSLFDEGVYNSFGVLTSAEIQRRFLRMIGNSRDSISIIREYFLLDTSSRKDVTSGTSAKLTFFSISSKVSTQNLKDFSEKNKVLDKEQKRTEKNRKENNIGADEPRSADTPVPFEKIKELYNSICASFPKIQIIDGQRRKAVAARWHTYKSLEVFQELFAKTEASDFLRGENDRNWRANFDWIVKPTNMAKVLEGNYDNDRMKGGGSYGKASGNSGTSIGGVRGSSEKPKYSSFWIEPDGGES